MSQFQSSVGAYYCDNSVIF